MKSIRFISLFLLAILLVVSLSSCLPNLDDQNSGDPTDIVKDLKTLSEGEEMEISLSNGKNSTIHLEGATIDSLYVIETNDSVTRGLDTPRDIGDFLSQSASNLYVILPQLDGKVSFSGLDVGITNKGSFKIKRLGNNSDILETKTGNKFFQYQIQNTGKNYRTSGDPEWMWPTYLNFYFLNLNDPAWERYKDQKIVIFQSFITYVEAPGGSETSERFGLVDIGNITYDTDISIHGLYDLSGKNWLSIYSYLRNPFAENVDFRFETHLLIPDEIEEGGDSLVIEDLPHAIILHDDFAKDKAYILSLRNIPSAEVNVLLDILESCVGIGATNNKVGAHNGEHLCCSSYIQSVTKHDDVYDADIYLTGIDEDFVIKIMFTHYHIFDNYGSISFSETNNTTWVENNCIDLSDSSVHQVVLDQDESLTLLWKVPENDHKHYKLSVSTSLFEDRSISATWTDNSGKGGGTGNAGGEIYFSNAISDGFMTILPSDEENTITWKVEEVEWEGNPNSTLDYIRFRGNLTNQRSFSEIDNLDGATIIAHYLDGTTEDVTFAPGLSYTTNTGDTKWGSCLKRYGGDWGFDDSDPYVIFTYTENGITRSVNSRKVNLNGELLPNTPGEPYQLENKANSYVLLDISGFDTSDCDDVFFPIDVNVDPAEELTGYYGLGAHEGDVVWAAYSVDDYNDGVAFTAEKLAEYADAIGANLYGTNLAPPFSDYVANYTPRCLAVSIDGSGNNGSYVFVVGYLNKDIAPFAGVTKNDFSDDGLKKFYVDIVDPT